MSGHIKRMKIEHNELKDKVSKLNSFIYETGGLFSTLSIIDQAQLIKQLTYMQGYLEVLAVRIWSAKV